MLGRWEVAVNSSTDKFNERFPSSPSLLLMKVVGKLEHNTGQRCITYTQLRPVHTVVCGHNNLFINFTSRPCPYDSEKRPYILIVHVK